MARYEELTIDQGSDVALELECVNDDGSKKNLTNYSVSAMAKRSYTDSDGDPETVTFNGVVADPASNGIVTLNLTNTQTDSMNTRGRYVYDVELSFVDSSNTTIIERILEGHIEVSPSVTKP